jgi:hypothetical protein
MEQIWHTSSDRCQNETEMKKKFNRKRQIRRSPTLASVLVVGACVLASAGCEALLHAPVRGLAAGERVGHPPAHHQHQHPG